MFDSRKQFYPVLHNAANMLCISVYAARKVACAMGKYAHEGLLAARWCVYAAAAVQRDADDMAFWRNIVEYTSIFKSVQDSMQASTSRDIHEREA